MRPITICVFFLSLLCGCSTPREHLEHHRYQRAFDAAAREMSKNKNVHENQQVLEESAAILSANAQNFVLIKGKSEEVKDWIEAQEKSYGLLEDLGKANRIARGALSESYDPLCDLKHEIDYKIVDHYYEAGIDLHDQFYAGGIKIHAQDAYHQYVKCKKYGGLNYFPYLQEEINEALLNGVVYYVSSEHFGSSAFFQPLPRGSDVEPDCGISVYQGFVSYSESSTERSSTKRRQVHDGFKTVTDTSGTVKIDKYRTAEAKVKTTTHTVTASITTQVTVRNISGQCPVRSTSYTVSETDTYEEVTVSGDREALVHAVVETKGKPSGFDYALESKLRSKAEDNISF